MNHSLLVRTSVVLLLSATAWIHGETPQAQRQRIRNALTVELNKQTDKKYTLAHQLHIVTGYVNSLGKAYEAAQKQGTPFDKGLRSVDEALVRTVRNKVEAASERALPGKKKYLADIDRVFQQITGAMGGSSRPDMPSAQVIEVESAEIRPTQAEMVDTVAVPSPIAHTTVLPLDSQRGGRVSTPAPEMPQAEMIEVETTEIRPSDIEMQDITTPVRPISSTVIEPIRAQGGSTSRSGLKASAAFESKQGRRRTMEDAHVLAFTLPKNTDYGFFAVYDGHGGTTVSALLADDRKGLHIFIDDIMAAKKAELTTDEAIQNLLQEAFVSYEKEYTSTYTAGSTAVAVLIHYPSKKAWFANLGDSRGLLIRNNKIVFETQDHKPNDPEESKRIISEGGEVTQSFGEPARVNGILAVARAFGDRTVGKGVGKTPDITSQSNIKSGDIIVLMCDGVTDVFSTDAIVKVVTQHKDAQAGSSALVNEAFEKGSQDNITAVVVRLE